MDLFGQPLTRVGLYDKQLRGLQWLPVAFRTSLGILGFDELFFTLASLVAHCKEFACNMFQIISRVF